jgi:tetratricopeptide (TPR) repeat protein
LGDLEGAKTLYQRTLALDREQQRTASTLCRLGAVLEDTGDIVEAQACYERALHVAEACHPDSPELVMALNRLSILLFKTGDRKRGRAVYQRALAVTKIALKEEAPEAAARAARIELAMQTGPVISHARH